MTKKLERKALVSSRVSLNPMKIINKSQQLLREIMGSSERTWGTGKDLPKFNGEGIDRNDDGKTGSFFGIKKRSIEYA